jgi:hypothetical protein
MIPDDMGIPSLAALAYRDGAMPNFREFGEREVLRMILSGKFSALERRVKT